MVWNKFNSLSQVRQQLKDEADARRVQILQKIMLEEKMERKRKEKDDPLLRRSKIDPVRISSERVRNTLARIEHFQQPAEIGQTSNNFEKDSIEFDLSSDDEHSATFLKEREMINPEFDMLWTSNVLESSDDANRQILAQNLRKKPATPTVDFVPKPECVQFFNFSLGDSYSKTLTLTNISSQMQVIRFKELSLEIRDFCTIKFDNHPALSPGMSASAVLTFRPVAPIAVRGAIEFATSSGPLVVPVFCRPPIIEPNEFDTEVNFGEETVGEIVHKSLSFTNNGALNGVLSISMPSSCDELEFSIDGEVFEGVVKSPFPAESTVSLGIKYSPAIVGRIEHVLNIKIGSLDGVEVMSKPLLVKAVGQPVLVNLSAQTIDLKVCTLGFLYQDHFFIRNESSVAKSFSVQLPRSVSSFLTIHPANGYVQAASETKIQIRFEPHETHMKVLKKCEFFEFETGVFEVNKV